MKLRSAIFTVLLIAAALCVTMLYSAELTAAADSSSPIKTNTMVVKGKSAKAKIKNKTVFTKAKLFSISKAEGKVTFKKVSGTGKVTISRSGKVTVKKGLKKNKTYKIIIKVRASGSDLYAPKSVLVKMTVKAGSSKITVKTAVQKDPAPVVPGDPEDPETPEIHETGISHVVIIGVDGAGALFKNANTPNLDKIMENGSVTYTCLTSNPTISAQCWGSMLHGVTPEYHKLTNEIVSQSPYPADSRYPSVFRVIRENMQDVELASFCNWDPINTGIIEDGIGVRKDTAPDDNCLNDKICQYLTAVDPYLMFIQFDEVDGAGHAHGYGSIRHLRQLEKTDGYIGQIYDILSSRGLLESTLFIVTSDHGGTVKGTHGGWSFREKYVMFAAAGPGIEAGTTGTMEVRDIASIVLYALGLPDKQPATWTSRVPAKLFKGVNTSVRNVYPGE